MMQDLRCPSCQTRSRHDTISRGAESFCPTCDFPLFWSKYRNGEELVVASGSVPMSPVDLAAHDRRRAGVKGIIRDAVVACPNCQELNRQTDTRCHRCGAELYPPKAARPIPEPAEPKLEPVIDEPTAPEPVDTVNWLFWIIAAVFLAFTVWLVVSSVA